MPVLSQDRVGTTQVSHVPGALGAKQPPEARQLPTTQKRALKAAAPQSPCTAQYGVAGPATDGAAPPQPPASPQHP